MITERLDREINGLNEELQRKRPLIALYKNGSRDQKLTPRAEKAPSESASASEEESIISFAEGSFSKATSISTHSDVEEVVSAEDQIFSVFVTDPGMSSLIQHAATCMSAERFERNFARLLKVYASGLRKEAKGPLQCDACRLIERRSRSLATRAVNSFFNLERLLTNASLRELQSGKENVLERYLQQRDAREYPKEDRNHLDDFELSSVSWLNIEQVRLFLTSCQAFHDLETDLRFFVHPKEALSSVGIFFKAAPLKRYREWWTRNNHYLQALGVGATRRWTALAVTTLKGIPWWFEASLETGKKRIRWKCVGFIQSLFSQTFGKS